MPLSQTQLEELVRKGPGTPDAPNLSKARDFVIAQMVEQKLIQWAIMFTVNGKRMQVRVDDTAKVVMWGTLEAIQSRVG